MSNNLFSIVNSIEIAQLLINKGAQVNTADSRGYTPLHNASERGFSNIVQLLLSAKADISASDKKKNTPLHFASKNGHFDVLGLLLKAVRPDLTDYGDLYLSWLVSTDRAWKAQTSSFGSKKRLDQVCRTTCR